MAIFLALALFLTAVVLAFKLRQERKSRELAIEIGDALRQSLMKTEKRVEELGKYQGIIDAEEQARNVITAARDEADGLKAQAKLLREEGKQKANDLEKRSSQILDAANRQADQIIKEAHEEAKRVAGSAFEAMEKSEELKRSVQAMKNIIDGYGDRYLVPSHSLLDDLADEFSHEEAGNRLKAARQATATMVIAGLAAQCDYVETERKTTAIHFVLDAFNGKVEAILSRVKVDNAGNLQEEIHNAHSLVNQHGRAFRDARITVGYLKARLEELKWAAIALALKAREREEQRAIKERLREEERARKEFERAIREAQKEEEMVGKALEKARKELEAAEGDKRVKLELRLVELQARLVEAESKNQRALSMAQQTKMGHVYIISNIGSFGEHVYKIGMTRRLEPQDRIDELGDASVPFDFDIHAMIKCEDAPKLEHDLHKQFIATQVNKVNVRKEFFRLSLADIRAAVESLRIDCKWTMTATAMEYKETLALEKRLAEDAQTKVDWLRNQVREVDKMEQEAVAATTGDSDTTSHGG